ncbi:MAG TPA: ABC transporter permease [Sphingomicrobium sp.]|nr:ABC transporter permease [Sphingomicrobium sp.]
MNNILLVAAREFRQIASMRSFWLTLLIIPLSMVIGGYTPKLIHRDDAARVMVIDRTGGEEARAISQRFEMDANRDSLTELSRYVQRHHLESADPGALWSQHDRWYSDADVARFMAEGGVSSAKAKIARVKDEDTPEFKASSADYEIVPVPPSLSSVADKDLDRALKTVLKPEDKETKAVDYVILVPADFGRSPLVRLWANSQPSQRLVGTIQDVLTKDLRTRFLTGEGVSEAAARGASAIAPALAISTPPPGGGAREAMLVRSILPLAASYLLMISLMLSGSWMLQGTVEERSNKLLETVLACVSPEELMYGKLIGTAGVGLFMIAVWIGCGLFAAYATQGAIADFIRPALDPLTSPGTIVTLIYFFIVGYLAIAVIFLAIGSMSDSMRDAQGYLMPVLLLILLPISILLQAVVGGNGSGLLVEVLTWVPIWTPFAVLARLGLGIPTWEVVGSGALLALFAAVELVMLGRLFRASLLAQGQRPNFAEMLSRMRAVPS